MLWLDCAEFVRSPDKLAQRPAGGDIECYVSRSTIGLGGSAPNVDVGLLPVFKVNRPKLQMANLFACAWLTVAIPRRQRIVSTSKGQRLGLTQRFLKARHFWSLSRNSDGSHSK
jgi:hypothetical protein